MELILTDRLDGKKHSQMVIKKLNKNMHVIRSLKSLNVKQSIIKITFDAMILSIIRYALPIYFGWTKNNTIKQIERFYKKGRKINICHQTFQSDEEICTNRLRKKILDDEQHPLNYLYKLLPHNRLNFPYCRTTRLLNSFIPRSIKYYNYNV